MKYSPRHLLIVLLGVGLSLFTLAEVNYPLLASQSRLALFALFGLVLCFLKFPLRSERLPAQVILALDGLLALAAFLCFGYVVVQSEPFFSDWWLQGRSLGNRAGQETGWDYLVGLIGLFLVLEGTRRSIGWTLPLLSLAFVGYAVSGPQLPDWLLPHRGYSLERVITQTFLQSQGVFGVALGVMFTYVFLFVILGALLRATGTAQFVIELAERIFSRGSDGPAKVAVLSSGLMGSLSGSAIANTATTGTFTIPLMRASGLKSHEAAGIEAAASSGGALVPPVMGAGAYMMLEIISPPVTYLQIIQAAIFPAVLYYLSLFLIVHFHARRRAAVPLAPAAPADPEVRLGLRFEGVIFGAAISSLIGFLLVGYTPFRAVTLSLGVILLTSALNSRTRRAWGQLGRVLQSAASDVVPLICASACVGVIIGIVTLTGLGSKIPGLVLPLAEGNLFLALILIMFSTILLGMGLPSAICYLLVASLMGPVLNQLGVVPLAAHLFIFYFGMMSMVTPPVALAAYAAASIAGSGIMQTSLAAFRFALVGFTLPFMFVLRPQLLLLSESGGRPGLDEFLAALLIAGLGILAFAAGVSGFLIRPLSWPMRFAFFSSAAMLLYPGTRFMVSDLPVAVHDVMGLVVLALAVVHHRWLQS